MKKRIFIALITVAIMCMFPACCISHEWKEATCTEVKTCTKCGETEGEALGHTWQEATCSAPKTCSRCGETEGKALEHTLSEANYQQGPTCQVCGKVVGEPLEPVSIQDGIVCNGELDVIYDYIAGCRDSVEHTTTAELMYTDYRVFEGDEEHESMEGYEWRAVTATVTYYADENLKKYGLKLSRSFGDYYSTEVMEETYNGCDFTINYYGEDYPNCMVVLDKIESDWTIEDTKTYITTWYFRVPIGYDGIYIYHHNGNVPDEEEAGIIYFRLNKEYNVSSEEKTQTDSEVSVEESSENDSDVLSDETITTDKANTENVTSNEQNVDASNSTNVTSSSGGVVFEIVVDQTCQHEVETISQKISDSYTYPVVTSYGYKCGACDSVVDESYIFCPVCNAEGTVEPYDVIEDVTVPAQYSCAEVCNKCKTVLRTWVEDGNE